MLFEIFLNLVRDVFDNKIFRSGDEEVEFLQAAVIDIPFQRCRCNDIVLYCPSQVLGICLNVCTDLQVELENRTGDLLIFTSAP